MNKTIIVILSKNNTFVKTMTYDSFLSIPNELFMDFRLLETRSDTYIYKHMKRNATFLKNELKRLW